MLRGEGGRFVPIPKVNQYASVGNIRGRIAEVDDVHYTVNISTEEDGLLRDIPILSLN